MQYDRYFLTFEFTQIKYLFYKNIYLAEPEYHANLKDILFSTKVTFLEKQGKKKLSFANVLNNKKELFYARTLDNFSS